VKSQSYSGPVGTNTAHLVLGDLVQSPGKRLDGSLDEVRISNSARSGDWVSTSYNNQLNPGTFSTSRAEEIAQGPVISDEQPLQGASHLDLNPTLQAHILDLQADSVQWWIRSNASGSWSTLNTGTLPTGDGTVTTTPSSMNTYNTTYWWSVNASDGVHWTNTSYRFTTQIGAPVISNVQPLDGSTEVNLNPTLQATIMDYQGDSVNWWIKSNATGSWVVINTGSLVDGNGTISGVPVTMYKHGTKYWWSVNASDGQLWTNETYRFITKPGLTQWQYRKRIVINHSMVSENFSGFAVLVQLTNDQDLKNHAQSDFDDVLFTYESISWANGTKADRLCHEIEAFNSLTGNLTAWVRCNLSKTTDTILYMYYGNPICARMENRSGAWDSSYRMVQHLNETTSIQYDSTSYQNDATPKNGVIQGAVGKIDGCDRLDGANDYIDCGNKANLNLTGAMTVSLWLKTTQAASGAMRILQKYADGYSLYLWSNGKIGFGDDYGFKYTNSAYNDGLWHYVVCRYNGSGTWAGLRIFVDGTEVTSVTNTGTFNGWTSSPTSHLSLGSNPAGSGNWFGGSLDEVRISSGERSLGWITTNYHNQYTPDIFSSIGPEEQHMPAWNVTIWVSAPDGLQDTAIFGEASDASDDQDQYDVPKPGIPPSPFVYTWLDANLSGPYVKLWKDYRRLPDTNKVWDLNVLWEDSIAKNILISWNSTRLRSSEYTIVTLKDVDLNIITDMLTHQNYTYLASPSTIHHFQIICAVAPPEYKYSIPLNSGWNLVSLPINQPFSKDNITVNYLGVNYTWQDAVSNSIILSFIYGWDSTIQNYQLTDILPPGQANWMYVYHNCALWISSNTSNNNDSLTDLHVQWNLIGLPCYSQVAKENLTILYNTIEYTWQEAVSNAIILGFIYGWNAGVQNYELSDILEPGRGYWMYAYHDCVLKKRSE